MGLCCRPLGAYQVLFSSSPRYLPFATPPRVPYFTPCCIYYPTKMDSAYDDQADWQAVGWNRRGLRGRRGGLRNMPHMPLDILVEVGPSSSICPLHCRQSWPDKHHELMQLVFHINTLGVLLYASPRPSQPRSHHERFSHFPFPPLIRTLLEGSKKERRRPSRLSAVPKRACVREPHVFRLLPCTCYLVFFGCQWWVHGSGSSIHQNCLRSNIQNILFEFSARYCRDCQRYL